MFLEEDVVLVEVIQAGDLSKWTDLYVKYSKDLVKLANKYTKKIELSEEVLQDAFEKAMENIENLKDGGKFKSWIGQIVHNIALNTIKKSCENEYLLGESSVEEATEDDYIIASPLFTVYTESAESRMEQKDLLKKTFMQIQALPEKQKQSIILHIFEDRGFKEVAEIMDCPYNTAKANFRHGILKLEQIE